MTRQNISVGIAGILWLIVVGCDLHADPQEQRNEIFLSHEYIVEGIHLKPGMYVVVHRTVMDKRNWACTFFYRDSGVQLAVDPSPPSPGKAGFVESILTATPAHSKFGMLIVPFKILPRLGEYPVASVHCKATKGPVVKAFTLVSTVQPDGSWLMSSIQFRGSTEVHNIVASAGKH
jgi:hypothetical protein